MSLKCLLGLLFLWVSALPLAGLQTDGIQLGSIVDDLTALEQSLTSLETDMIESQKRIKNLSDLVNLIESQSKVQSDLLVKRQKELTEELERFDKLSKLSLQLKADYERLKQSSAVKNWVIGGLVALVVGSFFIGYVVGVNNGR